MTMAQITSQEIERAMLLGAAPMTSLGLSAGTSDPVLTVSTSLGTRLPSVYVATTRTLYSVNASRLSLLMSADVMALTDLVCRGIQGASASGRFWTSMV